MYSVKSIYQLYITFFPALLLVLFPGITGNLLSAQGPVTLIEGTVTDAQTGEKLVGVSVYLPSGGEGVSTGLEGNFSLKTLQKPTKIRFSYLGYKTLLLEVIPGKAQTLKVELEPEAVQLNEVVVRGKKGRYRNKNNPAVDLIRKVVDHKIYNRPEQYHFLEYGQYEKMQLSLVNTPEKLKKNIFLRRYDFITSNLDTSLLPGKAVLPFYLEEKVGEHYYRKDPESRKTIVKAEKKVDLGEFFDNKGLNAYMHHMYQDIDIYENNITVLTNQFLSPVADMAPAFYKFHIIDTIAPADGAKLAELHFEPRNPAAFMFTGTLFITLDGNYAVQRVSMETGKGVSINWVRSLKIELLFEKNREGRYHLRKSELKTEFGITQNGDAGFYGERVVSYKNYKINKPRPDSLYQGERVEQEEQAPARDESYWLAGRHESLSAVEAKTYANIDSLTSLTSFKRTMDWATAVIAGYKRLGPDLEAGPLNTFYSFNPVEGFRLRAGGRTTTDFSKRFTFETYVAYGFKDEKWKYYLGGAYSLTGRSVYEFPVKAVWVSYQKDTKIPGQELQFVQEDNFLLSFKRGENDKLLYNETYSVRYLQEFKNNFSYSLSYRNWQQSPAGSLRYISTGEISEETEQEVRNLKTSEVSLELRWAPEEKFFQGKLYRTPIPNRYPVIHFRAGAGLEGMFGGQYDYQKVDLNIYKRFYLSQLGYADVVTQGGYIFGQLPFPLLSIHRANQSYSYQLQSYNLMNFLEFVSDQYASLHIDHTFNGFIFNKIPLIKKAKLREFISFKVLYGKLREENIPEKQQGLLLFPTFAGGEQATYHLGNRPYMEASLGIGNIFNFFRIDVVKRLNYLHHPHVSDLGIRGRFKFDF